MSDTQLLVLTLAILSVALTGRVGLGEVWTVLGLLLGLTGLAIAVVAVLSA